MSLRLYQEQCLEASVEERNANIWAQLNVLPTGVGKMVCIANLLRYHPLGNGEQVLFTVHRDTLIQQAVEKFRKYNPQLRVDAHTGNSEADKDADVVVASVQTIGRFSSHVGHTKRITKFDPDRFRIVVIDEAHRCTSKSYEHVLRYCNVLKSEKPDTGKLLSLWTATPNRTDQIGLDKICQKIVFERSIRSMIHEKWLAPIKAYMIQTDADISGVKARKDDFIPGQLAEALDTPERNDLIVRRYMELGEELSAVAFTISVAHSGNLAQAFHAKGITAFPISGDTPKSDRDAIFAAYADGRCRVLVSCEVLVEGWDSPRASCALMARPTKSTLFYQQSIGRVLRPCPAPEDSASHAGWRKDHALVLDFCDNAGRHSLNTIPTLFGLNHKFDMAGKDVLETVEEVEKLQLQQPKLDLKQMRDIIQVRSTVSNIDLLKAPEVPPMVRQHSRFEWLDTGGGTLRLSLPDRGILEVKINALGFREIYKSLNGTRVLHCVMRNLKDALNEADKLIDYRSAKMMATDRKWRTKAPSEAQCAFLWRLDRDLRMEFPSDKDGATGPQKLFTFATSQYKAAGNMEWSKGALSRRIDRHTATRDQKQPFVAGQRRT